MSEIVKSTYKVTISDINYGGHMGNDRALAIFHNARIAFLENFGYSEMNIGENTSIILVEAYVRYKAEIFLHDELEISVQFTKCRV